MKTRETWLNTGCIVLLVVVSFAGHIFDEPYYITLATKVCIFALAAVGLNFILGYGGMVSLGHAAFFGIGGYTAGILASHALNYTPLFTWPFVIEGTIQALIIWPVAMILSALFALGIGALSLRTSGVYFIMITLAFAQMMFYFAISWPAYGGEDGLSMYQRTVFLGVNTMHGLNFFLICFIWLVFAFWGTSRIIKARFGLALQGIRQNPERVEALGIAPFKIRLIAFVMSGVITGIAGALYADLNRFVSPAMFSWHTSGEIMVFVLLGGMARVCGPLVGAAVFIALEQILGGWTEHWQFWLGAVLVGVVLFARGGLIGVLTRGVRHD